MKKQIRLHFQKRFSVKPKRAQPPWLVLADISKSRLGARLAPRFPVHPSLGQASAQGLRGDTRAWAAGLPAEDLAELCKVPRRVGQVSVVSELYTFSSWDLLVAPALIYASDICKPGTRLTATWNAKQLYNDPI